jgi:hypothetical protein
MPGQILQQTVHRVGGAIDLDVAPRPITLMPMSPRSQRAAVYLLQALLVLLILALLAAIWLPAIIGSHPNPTAH